MKQFLGIVGAILCGNSLTFISSMLSNAGMNKKTNERSNDEIFSF